MIQAVIYFLPALVSLLWAVIYSIRDDGKGSTLVAVALFVSFGYFATLAMSIWPLTPAESRCFIDLFSQLLAYVILILNTCFVYSLNFEKKVNSYLLVVMLFVSVSQVLLLSAMYYVIGVDKVTEFKTLSAYYPSYQGLWSAHPEFDTNVFHNFVFVDRFVFTAICALFSIGLVCAILFYFIRSGKKFSKLCDFVVHNGDLQRLTIINFMELLLMACIGVLIVLGRVYLFTRPFPSVVMSLMLSFILFLLAVSVYNTDNTVFHRKDLLRFHMTHTVFNEESSDEMSLRQVNSLDSRLEQCLKYDDIHLDPDMTIDILAERLGTNHTTLSYIINHNYGMSFRELLANKRIQSAKEYLLEHPLASMEEVAFNSGFNSQAVFHRRFKEMTEQTPKAWLHSQIAEKSTVEASIDMTDNII